VPDYTEIGGRWSRGWDDAMPPASLALVAKYEMTFSPGSSWQYSNTGYVVLGLLVDVQSRHPSGPGPVAINKREKIARERLFAAGRCWQTIPLSRTSNQLRKRDIDSPGRRSLFDPRTVGAGWQARLKRCAGH
jgi:hypothetical protein